MHIAALVKNGGGQNVATVTTEGNSQALHIPPKANGKGSGVNGGELLFLALATCCCNDIYREAAKRNLTIHNVEVTASGMFGAEGEPGFDMEYSVHIDAPHSEDELKDLIHYVDRVAEVHNTLRQGTGISLKSIAVNGRA